MAITEKRLALLTDFAKKQHEPEEWYVERDMRPGMEWNLAIAIKCDKPLTVAFMTHEGEGRSNHACEDRADHIINFDPATVAALMEALNASRDALKRVSNQENRVMRLADQETLDAIRTALALVAS